MIEFICPTCDTKYPAEIHVRNVLYIHGNQRVPLLSDTQDCETCNAEIEKEAARAKDEARRKVKERKIHAT